WAGVPQHRQAQAGKILSDLIVGEKSNTRTHGSQQFQQGKRPLPFEKLITQMLVRAFAGTLAKPPNTAISVPTQQALSALQGGGMGMANAYGIGGGGQGQTGGLQARAPMGLPDRSSYFGDFVPTS